MKRSEKTNKNDRVIQFISTKKNSSSFNSSLIKYQEEIIQDLTMNPIEKWVQKDKKPYNLMLKIFLAIFITYMVQNMNFQYNGYQSNQEVQFQQILFGKDDLDEMQFHTMKMFQDQIENIPQICQNNNDQYFQKFDCKNVTILAEAILFNTYNISQYNFTKDLDLDQSFIEQLNLTDKQSIKNFFVVYSQLTITIKYIRFHIDFQQDGKEDLHNCWDIFLTYKNAYFASITGQSQFKKYNCEDYSEQVITHQDDNINILISYIFKGKTSLFIILIVLILAFISLILDFKFFMNILQSYTDFRLIYEIQKENNDQTVSQYFKQKKNENQTYIKKQLLQKIEKITKLIQDNEWQSLGLKEKLFFLDFWVLFNLLSNLIYILTCLLRIMGDYKQKQTESFEILLGVSAFFAWLNIIEYIHYVDSINKVFIILQVSVPVVLNFLLGIMPIFMCYVFLGMSLFYDNQYFLDTQSTFQTLFSLMFGDQLVDFFDNSSEYKLQSQIYIMSYVALSILIFHSCIVAIICNKTEKLIQNEKNRMNDHFSADLFKSNNLSKNKNQVLKKIKSLFYNEDEKNILTSQFKKQLSLNQSQQQLDSILEQENIQQQQINQNINLLNKQLKHSLYYNKICMTNQQLDYQIHIQKNKFIKNLNENFYKLNKYVDNFAQIQIDDIEFFELNDKQKNLLVQAFKIQLYKIDQQIDLIKKQID